MSANHSVTAFPNRAAAVTLDLEYDEPQTIYVGGAGDVAVIPWGGATSVTFVGLSAGQAVPVRVKEVETAGTTATSLVRVY